MLVAIFGKTPGLSSAELTALYGDRVIPFGNEAALVNVDSIDFHRLGGTVKVIRLLDTYESGNWAAIQTAIIEHASQLLSRTSGKQTIGCSAYGLDVRPSTIQKTLLAVKKQAKQDGHSVRVVPNKHATLNAAQLIHNKVIGKGFELVAVSNGVQTHIGTTVHVQDIDAYSSRDYNRPKRSGRVGMLPPKLAQIMINLALGHEAQSGRSSDLTILDPSRASDLSAVQGADEKRTEAYKGTLKEHRKKATTHSAKSLAAQRATRDGRSSDLTILDPFCGTGVVLQEALLMGYNVVGSDKSPAMVSYTQQNLHWLSRQHDIAQSRYSVLQVDATAGEWPQPVDAVVSELDLGPPLTREPTIEQVATLKHKAETLITATLRNLSSQLTPGTPLCLAVPAWMTSRGITVAEIDQAEQLGYNFKSFHPVKGAGFSNGSTPVGDEELLYRRPGQFVGRKLLVLESV